MSKGHENTIAVGARYIATRSNDTTYEITQVGVGHRADVCKVRVSLRMNDGAWKVSNERAMFPVWQIQENVDNGRWRVILSS